MQKISACSGSPLSRSSSALGMAPIYGPAMGMVGDGDEHRDHGRIVEPQDQHGDEGLDADEQRVKQLAADVAAERAVGQLKHREHPGGRMRREQRAQQRAAGFEQRFFFGQQIDAGRQRDERIQHAARRPGRARRGRPGHGGHHVGGGLLEALAGIFKVGGQGGGEVCVGVKALEQSAERGGGAVEIAGQRVDKGADALHELRQDQADDRRQHDDEGQVGEHDGRGALAAEQFFRIKAGGDIQHIGQRDAARKRRKRAEHRGKAARRAGQSADNEPDDRRGGDQIQKVPRRARGAVEPVFHEGLPLLRLGHSFPFEGFPFPWFLCYNSIIPQPNDNGKG